ncbi:PREDICTED: BURP domain-containing protein 16-like [Ipomoea nil]|uniref:BURP domain-containing protein 16-like n=1 Tax=Ipomoea nil TaxID=35883 RepID=UPI000901D01A|nr:PREDICTED: BURP domain-containing protein 16-like [Ipomoea nil]
MASVPYLPILFLNLCFFLLATSKALSSSSIASQQTKFWSQNVDSKMPKSILSKLSPLSESETEVLASLVSKRYFTSNPKFCTTANLACSDDTHVVKTLGFISAGCPACIVHHKVSNPSFHFRPSDLKKGHKVILPDLTSQLSNRAFLPSQIGRNIPLSTSELQRIFPIVFSDPQTKARIDTSLRHCDTTTVNRETRSCLKTLEDMIQFSRKSLGQKHMIALASENTKSLGNQVVTTQISKPYNTDKIVVCHEEFFPFATYYCHVLLSTQVYAVDMVNPIAGGIPTPLFALCQMNTSSHVAFEPHETSPEGKEQLCQWITEMDIVWIGYD